MIKYFAIIQRHLNNQSTLPIQLLNIYPSGSQMHCLIFKALKSLGILLECKCMGPTADLRNQKFWMWSPAIFLTSLPGDSGAY